MSCPYKNIFGEPGTGAHSYRFMGFAIADTVLTLMLAAYTAWEFGGNVFLHFLFWIVIAELFHYAFGTQTAGLTMLGITACPHTS
jgi:hypothetical protein